MFEGFMETERARERERDIYIYDLYISVDEAKP